MPERGLVRVVDQVRAPRERGVGDAVADVVEALDDPIEGQPPGGAEEAEHAVARQRGHEGRGGDAVRHREARRVAAKRVP